MVGGSGGNPFQHDFSDLILRQHGLAGISRLLDAVVLVVIVADDFPCRGIDMVTVLFPVFTIKLNFINSGAVVVVSLNFYFLSLILRDACMGQGGFQGGFLADHS